MFENFDTEGEAGDPVLALILTQSSGDIVDHSVITIWDRRFIPNAEHPSLS